MSGELGDTGVMPIPKNLLEMTFEVGSADTCLNRKCPVALHKDSVSTFSLCLESGNIGNTQRMQGHFCDHVSKVVLNT